MANEKKAAVCDVLTSKSKLVSWDDQFDCYVWNNPRYVLKGITKKLKKRFYNRAPKPAKLATEKRKPKPAGKSPYLKGKKGGTLVHEQLEEFVEKLQDGVLLKNLDPRVSCIIAEVVARGWTIFEAEYCVGDKDLRLGTGVDLLCLTTDGKIAAIEIKTGYDNVQYEGPMKMRMAKPFKMLDVSPWAQHQLQLMTTVGLLEKMTGLQVSHAEVWVIGNPSSEGKCRIRAWPLHDKLVPMISDLLVLLSKAAATKKRKTYVTNASTGSSRKKR